MRESILTIPISEILEPREGCPICRMRDMLEQRTVEYIMGAAMMEPDVRIETNRAGFCSAHFAQMLKCSSCRHFILTSFLTRFLMKILNGCPTMNRHWRFASNFGTTLLMMFRSFLHLNEYIR